MKVLLGEAGRAALRAFIGTLLILLPGVLSAPNYDAALGLGVAALIASFDAAIKAIQVFIPRLSLGVYWPEYGPIIDTAIRAFLAAFIPLVTGILNAPDFGTAKSLAIAALIAGATALIRALQGALTPGDFPAPDTGLTVPPPPPADRVG